MIKRFGFVSALIVLAAICLALRLIGLDWDEGLYLHPDERFVVWVTTDLRWPATIGEYFNTAISPLNPYNTQHDSFVYGTFPSFMVNAIAGLFGMDVYGELHLVGRAVNALFDTGSVLITAWIARRFFGDRAGLLAGLLLAFTPLFLQSSHFFTVDTISTFFVIAAFACALKSWDRRSIGWMALAGVMVGLAGASKPNALVAIAFLALPVAEQIRTNGWRSLIPRTRQRVYPALPAALVGGFVAFWTFRLAMPYAFSGPNWWNISLNQVWLDDLAFWRAVQTGLVDMKPSIQWIDRTPVIYILQNMVQWGMGPLLGTASLVALGLTGWRILRDRTWPSWWLLGIAGWCVANIAMYGSGIAQNQRYLMQIYPFLIVLATGLLIELLDRWDRKWIAQLLITAVVVYTVVFGAAFDALYVRPITRIDASEWIYENVPPGSVLSNEYWDDALPLPRPGEDRGAYTGMTLDLYGDESQNSAKVTTLVGQLSQVDYIVLSSDRIIESVVRQPERYPVAVRYYEMLLNGELGFEPVANFTQGPEILGIEWNDTSAEESLTVYEHPRVRIFKKSDSYDAQSVFNELNAAWGYGGVHYIPGDPMPNQVLLSDADVATSIAADNGNTFELARSYPVLLWLLAMQIIALAAWPLTWRAFRKLPDAGWMLAKGVGLLGLAAITLGLVSWGPFEFEPGTIAITTLLLLCGSLAAVRGHRSRFVADVRQGWRNILTGEVVFTLMFLAIMWLRMHRAILPDQHLATLSGILRSATLPPLDPGLSGGVLHTHWAVLLPWAAIGKTLTLEPAVAYNLTIVGIAAITAGIVWSLVYAATKSWVAILAAVAVVWGSTGAFSGGMLPEMSTASVDLQTLAIIPIAAILIHSLISRNREHYLPLVLVALASGAFIVSASWSLLVTIAIVAIGLAIPAWGGRNSGDSWWPIVRRIALEIAAVIAVGIVLWSPAYAAFTTTSRGLVTPSAWSVSSLSNHLGLLLVLIVVVAAIGATHVLGSTLAEGPVGIVACGIAIGAIITFAAMAWVLDSALMILLLIALVTVIAVWHWLDSPVMLWSTSLILIGLGMLIFSQMRPFHALPAGRSAADQLVPLSWLMLTIAVSFAAGRLNAKAVRQARLPIGFAMAMICIALVIPSVANLQQDDLRVARASLSDPAILLDSGELQAAEWIQSELTGLPVMLTATGTSELEIGAISSITGLPSVLGDSEVQARMRPGWQGMVESRRQDVTTMYASANQWDVVSPLLRQYNVRYIVIGPTERAMFGATVEQSFASAASEGHVELVYDADGVAIYRVVPQED